MDDQKIENLLNLAVDASPQEREKSPSLNVGYDTETQTWEVIIRYSGEIQGQLPEAWQVVTLSGGYAIVTLPQQDLDVLAGYRRWNTLRNRRGCILGWMRGELLPVLIRCRRAYGPERRKMWKA